MLFKCISPEEMKVPSVCVQHCILKEWVFVFEHFFKQQQKQKISLMGCFVGFWIELLKIVHQNGIVLINLIRLSTNRWSENHWNQKKTWINKKFKCSNKSIHEFNDKIEFKRKAYTHTNELNLMFPFVWPHARPAQTVSLFRSCSCLTLLLSYISFLFTFSNESTDI